MTSTIGACHGFERRGEPLVFHGKITDENIANRTQNAQKSRFITVPVVIRRLASVFCHFNIGILNCPAKAQNESALHMLGMLGFTMLASPIAGMESMLAPPGDASTGQPTHDG